MLEEKKKKRKAPPPHPPLVHGVEAVGLRLYRDPFFPFVLSEYPVIMRRTGGFELDRHLVPHIVKPCQGFFILLRGNLQMLQFSAPSCGNKQERMMSLGAELNHHVQYLRQLMEGVVF